MPKCRASPVPSGTTPPQLGINWSLGILCLYLHWWIHNTNPNQTGVRGNISHIHFPKTCFLVTAWYSALVTFCLFQSLSDKTAQWAVTALICMSHTYNHCGIQWIVQWDSSFKESSDFLKSVMWLFVWRILCSNIIMLSNGRSQALKSERSNCSNRSDCIICLHYWRPWCYFKAKFNMTVYLTQGPDTTRLHNMFNIVLKYHFV